MKSMSSTRSRRRHDGFTLLELMIAIGVVVMLLSILLPAVHQVREHGKTLVCLSNLRQLGLACRAYSADNHDKIIPLDNRDFAQPPNANGYPSTDSWPVILVGRHYVPFPAGADAFTPTVFQCPSGISDLRGISNISTGLPISRTDADGASGVYDTSIYLQPGLTVNVWYGINGTSGSDRTIPVHRIPPDPLPLSQAIWTSMLAMHHPSDLVLIFDGLGANHMSVNANRINARHMDRTITNILLFDGHAESVATKGLPGGDGNANLPSGATATFSPANLAKFDFPKWRMDQ